METSPKIDGILKWTGGKAPERHKLIANSFVTLNLQTFFPPNGLFSFEMVSVCSQWNRRSEKTKMSRLFLCSRNQLFKFSPRWFSRWTQNKYLPAEIWFLSDSGFRIVMSLNFSLTFPIRRILNFRSFSFTRPKQTEKCLSICAVEDELPAHSTRCFYGLCSSVLRLASFPSSSSIPSSSPFLPFLLRYLNSFKDLTVRGNETISMSLCIYSTRIVQWTLTSTSNVRFNDERLQC